MNIADLGAQIRQSYCAVQNFDDKKALHVSAYERGVRFTMKDGDNACDWAIDFDTMRQMIDALDPHVPERSEEAIEADRRLVNAAANLATGLDREHLEDRQRDTPVIDALEEQFGEAS